MSGIAYHTIHTHYEDARGYEMEEDRGKGRDYGKCAIIDVLTPARILLLLLLLLFRF